MERFFDTIIIGAGPAGLAAGNILANSNQDFCIIERGPHLYFRSAIRHQDVVSGVAGGGLYSDGKLSFFPSGSSLYKLDNNLLEKSYKFLEKTLTQFNVVVPEFNSSWMNGEIEPEKKDSNYEKKYKSLVLNQEQLFNIGFYLYDQIGKSKLKVNQEVLNIIKLRNGYQLEIKDRITNTLYTLKTKYVLFAGGKFGSRRLGELIGPDVIEYKKFEFGYRIETEPESFDYNESQQTDFKLLMKLEEYSGLEFRTFCFCRNGYIVHGKFEGLTSFNGISNQPASSKMNFGLNLRIDDENIYLDNESELLLLQEEQPIVKMPIQQFLNADEYFKDFPICKNIIKCLETNFPSVIKSSATISGPSFEYFGYYPKLTKELKVEKENFWVAGDATGDFRGLLPSLISGLIVGQSIIEREEREKRTIYESIKLKVSPSKKLKTVFTAQSKKFFFCKDVICEFVFKNGNIPINPFQSFGYFLNDRVERDIVRNGNNELISRSDELWVFGPIADGVFYEIAMAHTLKLPVRFFSIGTFVKDINEIYDVNDLVFEPEVISGKKKSDLIKFIAQFYKEKELIAQLSLNFDGINRE